MNLKKLFFILLFMVCTLHSVCAEETLASFEQEFEDGKVGDILSRGSVAILKEALRMTDETAEDRELYLQDTDQDTLIQVEETGDEDKIRFDTGGTQRLMIDSTGMVGMIIENRDGSDPTSPVTGQIWFRTD